MTNYKVLTISILFFCIALMTGVGVYAFGQKPTNASSNNQAPIQEPKDTVFGSVSKKVFYAMPSKLRISTADAKLYLPVIEVGLDQTGALEAPKDWDVAGWYKKSAKPGEFGNLIIDGHYDNNFGAPAAFWELKNLKTGDKVELVDTLGRTFTYQIFEIYYVNINDPDRLRIFEDSKDTSQLTLVTCGGIWLPGEFNYSQRLVVKGNLAR